MPAKAVEECPEGNDLRPPSTDESLLVGQAINGSRVMQTTKDVTLHTPLDVYPICIVRESRDATSLGTD